MYKKLTIVLVFVLIVIFTPIGGYSVHYLQGDSMEPTIQNGSLAIVDHNSDLEKDDIVAYRFENRQYAHRYIEKAEDSLILSGDNEDYNHILDSQYVDYEIHGEVVYYTEI